MNVALIICTVGRASILAQMLPYLAKQSRMPDQLVIVATSAEDVPDLALAPETEVLLAPKGLPIQRNVGLDRVLIDADIVVFIDDDYVPQRHMIANIITAFKRWPDVAGMTGHLLADGINTAGLSIAEAGDILQTYDNQPIPEPEIIKSGLVGLYGCNMAFRADAIASCRFDEALPLYGWQEDVDFAARLKGNLVRTNAFCGVHCGVKTGRETGGRRLGYSQVSNVIYLIKKGSVPAGFGLRLILRNMTANLAHAPIPEPWIDRRARVRGNWLAVWDVLCGRITPERILDL
ncbi:MAG: glycosyltransferase family 2 protein [Sedimentitalea sp.]